MNITKTSILFIAFICFGKFSNAQFTTTPVITQVTTGNVGIGIITPTVPNALLEVKNGNVVFDGSLSPGSSPIIGAGTRMMWLPIKGAFRAGAVSGGQWDDSNVGSFSFASGGNTIASGLSSTAMGTNTTASGSYSSAMGATANASGNTSFSVGVNTLASGDQSNAFGYYTKSTGVYTTSFGQRTTAQSYNCFVIGRFNYNPGTYSATTWVATEPLFVIGNGASTGTANNALTVLKNGFIGISTATPEDLLQVGKQISKAVIGSAYGTNLGNGTSYLGFNASRQNTTTWSTATDGTNNGGSLIYGDASGGIRFATIANTGATNQTGIADATIKSNVKLLIQANGNVGIGTDLISNTANYKLSVNGDVRAKKIVVENTWADFVFDKNYKLSTLKEIEEYISVNGHLPEMPTAKEIETNGADLGELVKLQMQKIEELTLFVIEQNKRIELLEKK
jgi:hypothetical protein